VEGGSLRDHLDRVGPSGRDQHRRLAVRQWEVRDHHGAVLFVASVGPVAQRGFLPRAEIRFVRAVGAPGHDRLPETPENHVAEERLPVLLAGPRHVPPVVGRRRGAREVLGIREQAPPLALEQVHHVQVLSPLFEKRPLSRQEVDVRIARIPAVGIHRGPPLQPQGQFSLTRLDPNLLPQRLVFESSGDVHDQVSTRKPSLTRSVDVRIRDAAKTQVAPDVDVPRSEIGIDVVVMTVRLIRHAGGRTEMDPARDWSAGLVVEHGDVDPVPALL
jgi:hypothetical protein